MSNNCRNNNLLQRDGTSRQQRLLKALLPDYVAVDERKIEDLKSFVQQYAHEINYYDADNNVSGDWVHFFEKKLDPDQQTEPHYALFLAFLQLFNIAQGDLNQITRKHLNFYYRDVLQLKEKEAVADQAFMIFELAKHVDQHLLKEGMQLKAGKDDLGNELIYETNRDIVINTATVGDIKAVFKDEDSRIYASPQANSTDGMGAEIESAEMNWRTFGKPEGSWPDQDRTKAEVGFAFASPILFLAEGDREVTITLKLNDTPGITEKLNGLNLRRAFRVRFSGEEDWIEPYTVEEDILQFLNDAESWQDIAGIEPQAGPVFDDPAKGYSDPGRGYDIGKVTATKMLEKRRKLGSAGFTSLSEVRSVQGVGEDKINDLFYTFRNRAIEERILQFLNDAESWQDIAGVEPQAGPVFDDPEKGHNDGRRGYDIGEVTAKEILERRGEGFTSLDEVRSVRGVGEDKINDLFHTFRKPADLTMVHPESREIIINRTVSKAQDPIVAYQQNEETLLDPFQTRWPVVKITLRTDLEPYMYDELKNLQVEKANICVHVSEVRELIIQNDQSVLDPSKNFQPFGIRPELGSNFYIGNREVFSKRLDMLNIYLRWHGLPDNEGGFPAYYEEYHDGYPTPANSSFKSNIYLLDKKAWIGLATDKAGAPRSLFRAKDSGELIDRQVLSVANTEALAEVKRDSELQASDAYDTDSRKGFLRLELAGTDFGHEDYQPSYTQKVLAAFNSGHPNGDEPMPNEPYTPLLKEIYLNYRTSVDLNLGSGGVSNSVEQFFHVSTFGVSEQTSSKDDTPVSLVPQYNSEGILYIGVEDFEAGQTLSLLFQVAEGSADPDLTFQPVKWSYLSDNRWVDFSKFDILSDGTSGLLTSGIINFDVSKKATDHNTRLPAGMHWLRATVNQESDAIPDLIQIMAQAVPATFKDQDNDPDHLKEALPAETISKLKVADSAIGAILQPFASFGGKTTEQKSAFYTRVSERLRHKNRAVTNWDYERLVLEKFPAAYKAKCLNHTRYTGSLTDYSEMAPGHVTLVVISNVKNKNAVDPLRPKTSLITLNDIHNFVSELNAACVDLHVKNPIYEEIKVGLNVKFREGFDNGFYGKKLEDDLKGFLSPWAFDATSELVFGGKIHKSVILNYVEERPYVDFITCFEMYHIIKNPSTDVEVSRTKVDEAVASTAVSILGSVGQVDQYGDHDITVLETRDCECDDNEIKPTASIASADECGCEENQQFET